MASANQKNPVYDIPLLHKNLYSTFVYETFEEKVLDFRNHISKIFAIEIVSKGKDLARKFDKMA